MNDINLHGLLVVIIKIALISFVGAIAAKLLALIANLEI